MREVSRQLDGVAVDQRARRSCARWHNPRRRSDHERHGIASGGSGYTAVPAEAMLRAANRARARRGEERSAQAASLPWRFDARVSYSGLKAGCMCGVAICIRDPSPTIHTHSRAHAATNIVPPPLLRTGGVCAQPCGHVGCSAHSQPTGGKTKIYNFQLRVCAGWWGLSMQREGYVGGLK